MRIMKPCLAAAALFAFCAPALADSCWMHNGSLMRLRAEGERRVFSYERARDGLISIGVSDGDVLFEGVARGGRYYGKAKLFSTQCTSAWTDYDVSGPISPDQLRVTLRGTRDVYNNCAPTGRKATDTLVFTYARQC